jgi:hypothetical protein
MSDPRRHLPQKLIDELDGLDWCARHGRKHIKLFVRGYLIGVFPRGAVADHTRSHKLRAAVRKYRKSHCPFEGIRP